jgi:pyruvate/2-oxoglutarate dehydrogenase complex dihydrolipoamide dehydrogenase (E3) component
LSQTIEADLCVIGAGSAGLSVAAGASQMGATVVLVEKGEMGGDCLNFGCVPSKALLAAAHAAQDMRDTTRFGVAATKPSVDWAAVRDHVKGVIAGIAPHDSVERFEGLGVTVIRAAARFVGPTDIVAGDATIHAKRVIVATGSSPMVPPIPGLDTVPYFTNETIFDNATPIDHLLVIGGGPIGMELAQAHRRLGAEVTVVEMATLLGKDDPELAAVVIDRLAGEGIALHGGTQVTGVEATDGGVAALGEGPGGAVRFAGSHLLVAVGRRANVAGLDLEKAGVDYSPRGVPVDASLRTNNRRVFAIGDVAGPYQFTHMAGYHAGIVIRRALFRLPAKTDYRAVPWVTYTDPELAHVGLNEAEARARHTKVQVLRAPFSDNDRARTEKRTEGEIKVIVGPGSRVLGATIVGAGAGDLLLPWCLMIQNKLKIGAMASVIAPYPTLSEISKRAAGSYFTPSLFGSRTRRLVRFLQWFG